jgi:DNA polymerase III epsilon subunit family exonuclease
MAGLFYKNCFVIGIIVLNFKAMVDFDYVLFDLETTGLSPTNSKIIQIAAIRMINGRCLDSDMFFSYVNPGCPIPPWITHFTGITNKHVNSAPTVQEVILQFSKFTGNSTLIAHNAHRFDMRFLEAVCTQSRLPIRVVPYHDSISLSWMLWGRQNHRHGLDAIVARLGIACDNYKRHDARGDVLLLAKAVEIMWKKLEHAGMPVRLPVYHGLLPRI